LYRVWIRKSVHGTADGVLVLDEGGQAQGFITCRLPGRGLGEVPLAGLSAEVRGRGLAQVLYAAALDWLAARGVATARYVTQARNVRAQRVLQRLGFLTESAHVWYHKWFDPRPSGAAARVA
jgi:ribosomal protein S18 acetylase RimI-like enzyme